MEAKLARQLGRRRWAMLHFAIAGRQYRLLPSLCIHTHQPQSTTTSHSHTHTEAAPPLTLNMQVQLALVIGPGGGAQLVILALDDDGGAQLAHVADRLAVGDLHSRHSGHSRMCMNELGG